MTNPNENAGKGPLVKEMVVSYILIESDRTVLFREDDYKVIAPPSYDYRIGQRVSYTPEGVNFGWIHPTPEDE